VNASPSLTARIARLLPIAAGFACPILPTLASGADAANAQNAVVTGAAGPEQEGHRDPQSVPAPSEAGSMKPYVVSEGAYKAFLLPSEIRLLEMFQWLQTAYDYGPSNPKMSGSFVATPLRIPQHPKNSAFTAYAHTGGELTARPAGTLEGALVSEPEVGPWGRGAGSPPETQNQFVTLRGVGGGSPGVRVILDGIPFEDPFDGSVPWPEAPFEGLARVEVVPGGGATAWGDRALGGAVQIFTLPPSGELVTKPGILFGGGPPDPTLTKQVVAGTGQFTAIFGEFDTRSLEFVTAQPTGEGVFQVLGNVFSTAGFPVVSPAERGPIDTAAWNRHDGLEARWRQLLGKKLVLTATLRGSEESHGDGTPYQQGDSEERFASVCVAGNPSTGFAWNAAAYVQDAGAASRFGYVNPARTAETPAIDQFARPVTSVGATWSGEWWDADGSGTSAGIDLHHVRGETRDDFGFLDGRYASELIAGGEQGGLGAFLLRDQELSSTLRLVLGARLDGWDETGGHQSESSLASGSFLTDSYAGVSGTEFSPSIGLVWRPSASWRVHANAQQSFSTPTLSELYQPYGEGAMATEANPLLRTERNTSFEAGVEYEMRTGGSGRKAAPRQDARRREAQGGTLTLGLTAFSNDLHDAVGDLALSGPSGAVPIFGSLPQGYSARQWINLDRSRIQGIALSAKWSPTAALSLDATVLLEDPTIGRVGAAPGLDGRQIAGVSRRSGAISATWHASRKISLVSRVRALGRQFEDDADTLRLSDAAVVDLRASYALTMRCELFATAENLADARVETSRSADGLAYLGAPRIVLAGLRLSW
jgi:outer membrane receptor protein involved in Fe transport